MMLHKQKEKKEKKEKKEDLVVSLQVPENLFLLFIKILVGSFFPKRIVTRKNFRFQYFFERTFDQINFISLNTKTCEFF